MYRNVYKNKTTGEDELLWHYGNKDGTPILFKDLTMKEEVDSSNYEGIYEEGTTGLPTPYMLFGIECGKGWYPLIQPVVDYIDEYNKNKTDNNMIRLTQVKEKYGTLRIYANMYTPELQALIDNAEEESEKVCEFCGSRENLGTTLEWYITICYDCMKDRVRRRDIPSKWHCYDDDMVYLARPHRPDEKLCSINEYEEAY